ncbi:hypothetical protein PHYBOEH_007383 [Phytophthora boehmeriae]|uniref:BZIP domain-containing protein n=1 Tax=Phytophthora boehmeriae TaxID=109152 RepID=A0A8T1WAA6_9STRA|nr:hypothetical protein PHYBOEH_007383 [Phytophthora boehmeriae]
MHDSALYPPNCDWLGDELVGQVVERGRLSSNLVTNSANSSTSKTTPWGLKANAIYEHNAFKHGPEGPVQRGKASSNHKRQSPAANKASQHVENSIDNDELEVRKRNRENKARYRKNRRDKAIEYEKHIRLLQEEIQSLERRRQLIASGVPAKSTVWNVVPEFFRLFRYGVKEPVETTQRLARKDHVQLDFLRKTMAPDLICNTECGVEALVEHLTCVSNAFQDLETRLVRLEGDTDDCVVATTLTTCTITNTVLQYACPHLVSEKKGWSRHVTRLLGQHISIRGVTRFHWDIEDELVTRIVYEADLLTPLLQILGTLEDVSWVFAKSLHTPGCTFASGFTSSTSISKAELL